MDNKKRGAGRDSRSRRRRCVMSSTFRGGHPVMLGVTDNDASPSRDSIKTGRDSNGGSQR